MKSKPRKPKRIKRRIEASKAAGVTGEQALVVSLPPPETRDPDFCQKLEEICKEDSSRREAILEWLRYEALRLAAPVFTAEKRRECAQELEQISTRSHECLLEGEWPQPVGSIHDELPRVVKRLSPITVLRSKRFKILDEDQKRFTRRNTRKKIYVERTLIVPDIDDPDPTWPGHLLPTRLCISVSVDIQHRDEDLTDSLLLMVQDARRLTLERERADGGGNLYAIASMAEALQLYEKWRQSLVSKKELGLKAKHFGAHEQYHVKASRVLKLATRMIEAATAGPAVWQKTFR